MSKNKNAFSNAGTSEKAHVNSRNRGCYSDADHTIHYNEIRVKSQIDYLATIFPIGSERPRTAKELAEALGVKNIRIITNMISRLRLSGLPICASYKAGNAGYYLPETVDELERYITSLKNRSNLIYDTCFELQKFYDEATGQIRIKESE